MSLLQHHSSYAVGFNPAIVGKLPGISIEQARQGAELPSVGYYLSALATPGGGIRVGTFLYNNLQVDHTDITVTDSSHFGLEYGEPEAMTLSYGITPITSCKEGSLVMDTATRIEHLMGKVEPTPNGHITKVDQVVAKARAAHGIMATLLEAAGCSKVDARDILTAYGRGLSSLHTPGVKLG